MQRPDGKLYDCQDPIYGVIPYVLRRRSDSMNMVTIRVPMEPMRAYLNRARKEHPGMSYLGLVLAAYVRAVSQYPGLNRFVVNRRVYSRNKFTVSMVVLKPGKGEGTDDKIDFEMTDTAFDVNRRMMEFIERNRSTETSNKTDKLAGFLVRHPLLIGLLVNLLIWMDDHNIMPKAIVDASPFHTSLLISNLGSIRINQIYHHVYDFGTTSVAMTIGVPEKKLELEKGVLVERQYLPLGVVMDERIASGYYFGKVLQYIQHLLRHPEELETPPEVVNRDPTR